MTLARSLEDYLRERGVGYEVLPHRPTHLSLESAHVSHVPAACFAKAVVLGDEQGYVMAVTPADHRLRLGVLHHRLGRRLGLATEQELRRLFKDCEPGAIPPLGPLYGMEVIVDEALDGRPEVYFEAGNHRDLIRVSGEDFRRLLPDAPRGAISSPDAETYPEHAAGGHATGERR
jgi:Ala-tRNA(Pro) deacylase